MSAFSIEWHEQCLANTIEYHKNLIADLARITAKVEASRDGIRKYQLQIDRAKKLGKSSFDSERFAAKKPGTVG